MKNHLFNVFLSLLLGEQSIKHRVPQNCHDIKASNGKIKNNQLRNTNVQTKFTPSVQSHTFSSPEQHCIHKRRSNILRTRVFGRKGYSYMLSNCSKFVLSLFLQNHKISGLSIGVYAHVNEHLLQVSTTTLANCNHFYQGELKAYQRAVKIGLALKKIQKQMKIYGA